MSYFLILIIVFIVILAFIFLTRQKQQKTEEITSNSYKYKSKPIMTDNEFEFFNRLIQAFPEHHIFPQVSMGAIMDVLKEEGKNIAAGRNTFNKKIIDYIIFSKEKKIVAIIELDDKTHTQEKDEKRDSMLAQASYKTFRFESKKKPTVEELKNTINIK